MHAYDMGGGEMRRLGLVVYLVQERPTGDSQTAGASQTDVHRRIGWIPCGTDGSSKALGEFGCAPERVSLLKAQCSEKQTIQIRHQGLIVVGR